MLIKKQTNVVFPSYILQFAFQDSTVIEKQSDQIFGSAIKEFFFNGNIVDENDKNSVDLLIPIINQINILTKAYCDGEYKYIPIYHKELLDDDRYYEMLKSRIIQKLNKYTNLFQKFKNDGLKELSFNRDLSINTTKGGKDTITKDYDTIINGENTLKSVNEIAPINASLDIIDTPNEKSINKNSNESKKTGSDTIDTIYGGTVNDIHKEISPELYEKFLKILDKYNIPQIIENIYRTIIYEFNMSL